MKHLFALALFFLACAPAFAQNRSTFQNLEGDWYRDGRQTAVYSRWFSGNDNTLLNYIYTLICGDTVLLSRAEIHLDALPVRMTFQIDSLGAAGAQIFRLARAGADELFWENENPAGIPARLSYIFFGANYLTFRADGVETDYRRASSRNTQVQFRLQAGAGLSSRRPASTRRFPPSPVKYLQQEYQSKPGIELAASIGLRGADSPLSCYLELGFTQKELGVATVMDYDQVQYTKSGIYRFSSFYLGFVPELIFGRRRAIAVSTGLYIDLQTRARFNGSASTSGSGTPDPKLAQPTSGRSAERGFMAGLAYELPFNWMGAMHPSIYTRTLLDLGNGAGLLTWSAGLRFRMGKD